MTGDEALTLAAVAASGVLGAGSSIAGGIQAQAAGNRSAQAAQESARQEVVASNAQVGASSSEAAKTIGEVSAAAGASGITAESAIPTLSEDISAARAKAAYERYSGRLAANADIYQANQARYQGKQAFWGGIIGAGNSLLSAAAGVAKIKMASGSLAPNKVGLLTGSGTPNIGTS